MPGLIFRMWTSQTLPDNLYLCAESFPVGSSPLKSLGASHLHLPSDPQLSTLPVPKINRQDEQIKNESAKNKKRGTVEDIFSDFRSNLERIFWPLPPTLALCTERTRPRGGGYYRRRPGMTQPPPPDTHTHIYT